MTAVHEWRCLFDRLMPRDPTEETKNEIDQTCEAIRQFAARTYGSEYSRTAWRHWNMIAPAVCRDRAIELAYILLESTHEGALHGMIMAEAAALERRESPPPSTAELERVRKMVMFYRVQAIAMRSLYETPFTDSNAHEYVMGYLYVCVMAWLCMDARAMSMFCDHFSSRWKGDLRADDGPLFISALPDNNIADSISNHTAGKKDHFRIMRDDGAGGYNIITMQGPEMLNRAANVRRRQQRYHLCPPPPPSEKRRKVAVAGNKQ
jgi:hypothetical protein